MFKLFIIIPLYLNFSYQEFLLNIFNLQVNINLNFTKFHFLNFLVILNYFHEALTINFKIIIILVIIIK
jgi:hypothetical protein